MGKLAWKSFTLIEIVIALGVIALVLPAVFSIFFSILRQQLVLLSYQEIKYQGDSAQRNIQNILQNRAAFITDSAYAIVDCPLPLTPTPTYSPDLYIEDRSQGFIHLYPTPVSPTPASGTAYIIASDSADTNKTFLKTYDLTSKDVTISNLGFSCHRINEFTPDIVSTRYTASKSAVFNDVSLIYTFNVRLRDY